MRVPPPRSQRKSMTGLGFEPKPHEQDLGSLAGVAPQHSPEAQARFWYEAGPGWPGCGVVRVSSRTGSIFFLHIFKNMNTYFLFL